VAPADLRRDVADTHRRAMARYGEVGALPVER
jgi:hypothetical protein